MKGPLSTLFRTAALTALSLVPPPRVAAFLRHGTGHTVLRKQQQMAPSTAGDGDNGDESIEARVVVLGGGFGGLYTALRLSQLANEGAAAKKSGSGVSITLVDSRDKFVFLPLLYELATGQAELGEVAPRMEDVLRGTNIEFVQGNIDALDLTTCSVTVTPAGDPYASPSRRGGNIASDDTRKLSYDRLVVALGSQPRNLESVPGAGENCLPFYTVEDAYRLQRLLARLDGMVEKRDTTIHVVVVGGGYVIISILFFCLFLTFRV